MKLLVLFLFMGCAQVTSLNLKKHQFGLVPTKIIWFQIAGLEEEQIALLRFEQTADKKTSFEDNICYGQTWNYNLYKLRNSAETTFLSQMLGKKNIKENCEDSKLKPIWDYIYPNGYITAVLESGTTKNQSLLNFNKCGDQGKKFIENLYFFTSSAPIPGAVTFHYSDQFSIRPSQVVYDRTCGEKNCGSSITDNFKAIYSKFKKLSSKHLMVIRDYSYLSALEKKDFSKARDILEDIERAYADALKLTQSNDYLILLTTGDSRFVDMPSQGKDFFEFSKNSKNISVKRTKLTNLVLASGARSENFCGIYDDADIFDRILSGPKQQGLEFKVINPFK